MRCKSIFSTHAVLVVIVMACIAKGDEQGLKRSELVGLYSKTHISADGTRVELRSVGLPGTSPDGRRIGVTMLSPNGERIADWEDELDGDVEGSWLADLDGEGRLEIAVFIRSFGTGAYGSLLVIYTRGDALIAIPVEHGGTELRDSYMGHDHFFVSGDTIMRAYPLYGSNDSNCCPHGGAQVEMYRLKGTNILMTAAHSMPHIAEAGTLETIDRGLEISDSQGHGPDYGSAEWWSAVRSGIVAQFEEEQ